MNRACYKKKIMQTIYLYLMCLGLQNFMLIVVQNNGERYIYILYKLHRQYICIYLFIFLILALLYYSVGG